MTVSVTVPVLDFSLFRSKSVGDQKAFASDLVKSFQDHGFVKLINHGLPESTARACMKSVRILFQTEISHAAKAMES